MSILVERVSRNVISLLINRPHTRNALNLEAIIRLKEALRAADEDEETHAIVIAGVRGNFSSGYDVKELIDPLTSEANISQLEQMLLPLDTRLTKRTITVAAIEGHAAGFGYELALRCDFRVGDRDARLGFMNRRLGIPIMNGGTVLLPELVGQARALELIATGKAQLAPEALQYGIIHYISNVGCAIGRAINVARCVAKFDQATLLHDLQSLKRKHNSDERDNLLLEERNSSLEYLRRCGKLHSVSKFINGELYRHGNYDMGNIIGQDPQCTL